MTVLTVFFLAVLESTLPSFPWSYKIQDKEATVTDLTVLAVLAVVAVSVVTATPLKLNPPFPSSRYPTGKINDRGDRTTFYALYFCAFLCTLPSINNFSGFSQQRGGGQNCVCVAFLLGGEKEHISKFP